MLSIVAKRVPNHPEPKPDGEAREEQGNTDDRNDTDDILP
jgi:hypothetical protein